ncbi:hypothetical protein K2X05_10695 [bacterium]|nr:hypothetical protein [bacterium]
MLFWTILFTAINSFASTGSPCECKLNQFLCSDGKTYEYAHCIKIDFDENGELTGIQKIAFCKSGLLDKKRISTDDADAFMGCDSSIKLSTKFQKCLDDKSEKTKKCNVEFNKSKEPDNSAHSNKTTAQ